MGDNYKAVPYKVMLDDEWSRRFNAYEIRYRIVSLETGEVLDDAQGYGYKTATNAYSAYSYKIRDKSKDKAKKAKTKRIKQWMKEHEDFVEAMDIFSFQISKGSWGPDVKFNSAFVRRMLEDYKLEPDFTANELLSVWRN